MTTNKVAQGKLIDLKNLYIKLRLDAFLMTRDCNAPRMEMQKRLLEGIVWGDFRPMNQTGCWVVCIQEPSFMHKKEGARSSFRF